MLSGDVSPSGKLPTTIPMGIEDTPAFKNYPGENGKVRYGEGVFVGYRWYDAEQIEPRFCFGHGLSYTTFDIGDVTAVHTPGTTDVRLEVPVTNTGTTRAAEVVQCYVADLDASVARPPQELKAFAKVWLDPGESDDGHVAARRTVVRVLEVEAAHDWTVEPGEFELRIGTSSRDIRRRVTDRDRLTRDR